MNRNTMLPFSVEKATPVTGTANASVPSAAAKTPAPPSTPVVATTTDENPEAGEADKNAAPSEKIWAAIRSFGAWKATVLGSGPPSLFTVSSNVADGSLGGRQSSAARIVELEEEKEDHVYLPIIPEQAADGQSKNLKGETIVGAVCDIRHSPNRILRAFVGPLVAVIKSKEAYFSRRSIGGGGRQVCVGPSRKQSMKR
ncbi:hypothetical protein HPB50_025555 [Hyalomma asiaticum]|uniref:Uncharacterized protein n=1 Tax=Hyalomma asiaticum TaxID=266040 RepID=A0ACB7RJZ1_HYAAI|nr:hypothetical protein HPB50_025555 [Hyalomma asiaticum]